MPVTGAKSGGRFKEPAGPGPPPPVPGAMTGQMGLRQPRGPCPAADSAGLGSQAGKTSRQGATRGRALGRGRAPMANSRRSLAKLAGRLLRPPGRGASRRLRLKIGRNRRKTSGPLGPAPGRWRPGPELTRLAKGWLASTTQPNGCPPAVAAGAAAPAWARWSARLPPPGADRGGRRRARQALALTTATVTPGPAPATPWPGRVPRPVPAISQSRRRCWRINRLGINGAVQGQELFLFSSKSASAGIVHQDGDRIFDPVFDHCLAGSGGDRGAPVALHLRTNQTPCGPKCRVGSSRSAPERPRPARSRVVGLGAIWPKDLQNRVQVGHG